MKTFTFNLTEQEVSLIAKLLMQQPYISVFELINKLQEQHVAQLNESGQK